MLMRRAGANGGANGGSIKRMGYTRPPGGRGVATKDPGPLSPAERRAFAAGASALAATAVVLALAHPGDFTPAGIDAISHALVVVTPVAVGLYALHRGAAVRFAFLLIAAGFFW